MLEQALGPHWPLIVLLLVGVLPNEVWRIAAAVLARRVDEGSQVFVMVRLVSTALIAAVVAKLLVQPPPALSLIPAWGRVGAMALAVAVYFLAGRSMVWAVLCGVAGFIAAAAFFGA